eukprot:TRINITY_DN65278_c0_g1_i1.p1 TRINITY_DN65278_c0_g1~~TRINITY_DN65278_c0_g1_i1.p1  ORF type:complete len:364 (+),score=96.01 TRINITY_DN65278_c0_g1_i1:92-1183(+)
MAPRPNPVDEFMRNRHSAAHKLKLARCQSSINNTWSVKQEGKLQVSRVNAKKQQLADERYSKIEKDNMRLLGRMQEIEHRSASKAVAQLLVGGARSAPAAPIRSSSMPAGGIGNAAGSRTNQRLKELQKIDVENQRLLKRLQGAQSSVNMKKFDEGYRAQQNYMKMRCERPKEEWIHERAHNSAAIGEALRQKAEEKLKALLGPEPESIEPAGPTDAECRRLLHLQDDLRRKAKDDDDDDLSEAGDTLLDDDGRPLSQRSTDSNAKVGDDTASPSGSKHVKKRFTCSSPGTSPLGGVIPENSKNLVEQLLAEYAKDKEDDEEGIEAETAAAKKAAEAAFREAEACDVASDELLDYDKLIYSCA